MTEIHGESEGIQAGKLYQARKMNMAKAHIAGLSMGEQQIAIVAVLTAQHGPARARVLLQAMARDVDW